MIKCSLLHILKKGGIVTFSKKLQSKAYHFNLKNKKNYRNIFFVAELYSFSKLGAWHIFDIITSKLLFLKGHNSETNCSILTYDTFLKRGDQTQQYYNQKMYINFKMWCPFDCIP